MDGLGGRTGCQEEDYYGVLILVLMEYGLGQAIKTAKEAANKVLILVLMEYGLGRYEGWREGW